MTLGGIYLTTVAISAIVQFLNNQAAKDTIRRNGLDIDYDNTTGIEKFNYFLSDYFFLLLPVYNLYKSIIKNRVITKPHEYAAKRLSVYQNRNMIVNKKEEPKVVEVTPVKEKEVPELPPRKESNSLPKSKDNNFDSKADEYRFYKEEFIRLKREYEESTDLPYEVRKAMYDKLVNYKSHIASLKNSIAYDKKVALLRSEADELESSRQNVEKLELN